MSKRNCELCNKPARMFCESDQASLCFHCDEKVHAANFLVAKHSRTLLCHVCGSPTAWSAHGPKLGPTLSVCHACSSYGRRGSHGSHHTTAASVSNSQEEDIEDNELYSEESDEQYDEDEDDDDGVYDSEEDGEGENQVVPWSEGDATWQSDSSDDAFESEDEDGCCSSQHIAEASYDDDSPELRASKIRRRNAGEDTFSSSSGTAAIIEKLQSFHQQIIKPLS